MVLITHLYLLFFSLIMKCTAAEESPIITTKLGKIKGELSKSFDGRTFSQFEGIPFAKPPIGHLRFSVTLTRTSTNRPWSGIWNATTKHTCLQKPLLGVTIIGNEDCLYANVYVPRENPIPNENLDVIIHIHGGAFQFGSNHEYCNPNYLMDRDIILVTFNYRLGVFGFLTTLDDAIPGNLGLKDQVVAMKWVKENIASFGGNPNSITLTGLSAGGASVHLHYFSPLSKGLFHRGLSNSGSALNPWSIQEEHLLKARKIAASLDCPEDNNNMLVQCLRSRPAKEIIKSTDLLCNSQKDLCIPLSPVVETDYENAFLFEHPYKLLRDKKILDVPWIVSTTTEEGLFILLFVKNELDKFNNFWDKLAPYLLDFNYTVDPNRRTLVSNNIKDFYIGKGNDINENTLKNFTKMITDRYFASDVEVAARLQSEATTSPVYYINFGFEGSLSIQEYFANERIPGVSHCDDILYMFGSNFMNWTPTDNDIQMKDKYLDMLVKYGQTGIPVFNGVNWKPTRSDQLTYLDIVSPTEMVLKTVKELSNIKFWEKLGLKENANLFIRVKDEL